MFNCGLCGGYYWFMYGWNVCVMGVWLLVVFVGFVFVNLLG